MKTFSFFQRGSILGFVVYALPLLAFDLESLAQDFVVDTQQITVAGHLDAFNPSIVKVNGKILMSFRELDNSYPEEVRILQDGTSAGYSRVGLVWLNEKWEVEGEAQMLEAISTIEDPRLVAVDDQLYMVYAAAPESEEGSACHRRVFVSELNQIDGQFVLGAPLQLSQNVAKTNDRHEKNWTPFDYDGQMHFSYSLNPHTVLDFNKNDGSCNLVATTNYDIPWCWGELRGGTPALKIDDHHYLGFFHSSAQLATANSEDVSMPHYFVGAYMFEADAPFSLVKVSYEPIVASGFYSGENHEPYWNPVRVVFPCGFIFEDDFIYLSYGRQDRELWVAKIDKEALIESLAPMSIQEDGEAKTWPADRFMRRHEIDLRKNESKRLIDQINEISRNEMPPLVDQIDNLEDTYAMNELVIQTSQSTGMGWLVHALSGNNAVAQAFDWLLENLIVDYHTTKEYLHNLYATRNNLIAQNADLKAAFNELESQVDEAKAALDANLSWFRSLGVSTQTIIGELEDVPVNPTTDGVDDIPDEVPDIRVNDSEQSHNPDVIEQQQDDADYYDNDLKSLGNDWIL